MNEIRSYEVLEDNPKVLLDRVEIAGVLMLQADVTAVYVRVWEYFSFRDARDDTELDGAKAEVGAELTFAAADVVFDALQTDGQWKRKDTTGYNLRIKLPASRVPTGGKYYRVQTRIDRSAAGEDDFYLEPWILHTRPIAGT